MSLVSTSLYPCRALGGHECHYSRCPNSILSVSYMVLGVRPFHLLMYSLKHFSPSCQSYKKHQIHIITDADRFNINFPLSLAIHTPLSPLLMFTGSLYL